MALVPNSAFVAAQSISYTPYTPVTRGKLISFEANEISSESHLYASTRKNVMASAENSICDGMRSWHSFAFAVEPNKYSQRQTRSREQQVEIGITKKKGEK